MTGPALATVRALFCGASTMKPLGRITLLAIVLIGSLPGIARAESGVSDRAALETALQRWLVAVNAQDSAALTATMTDDVELSNEVGTVAGRDAAIRALREFAARGRLVATTRELTIAGDLAWHVVGLMQTTRRGDSRAAGQALEIWQRRDGLWQLHRRMAAGASRGDLLKRPTTKEPVLDRPDR